MKQSVLLDGIKSTEADVLSGVPQGTVLWSVLFMAFINGLPESTKHSDARLFADDCLIYRNVTLSQDQAGKKSGKCNYTQINTRSSESAPTGNKS